MNLLVGTRFMTAGSGIGIASINAILNHLPLELRRGLPDLDNLSQGTRSSFGGKYQPSQTPCLFRL